MKINHVLTSSLNSSIFDAIMKYFHTYLPKEWEVKTSQFPIKNMDVYHYHRPHIETKLKPNSILTVHHALNDFERTINKRKIINLYSQAKQIVCLNSVQKESLSGYIDPKRISIIPHGFDPRVFKLKQKRRYLTGEQITLGVISKRYERRVKGEAHLIELLKHIDKKIFQFTFVGENRFYDHSLAKTMGFNSFLYESYPYRIMQNIYEQIDYLLILSNYEGGPANIPEAMATGTPILSTKVGMGVDMIKNNKNGKFLDGVFGDLLTDIKLFNDLSTNKEDINNKLFEGARFKHPNLLSWDENVRRYINVYQKVL